MSIRNVLVGGVLVLTAIGTGIVTFVGAVSIHDNVLREAQARVDHDLDTIMSLYRRTFQTFVEQVESELDAIVQAPTSDKPVAPASLQRLKEKLGFAVLNVCDPEGRPLVGAYPDEEAHVPVEADPVLRRALIGKASWGTVLLGPDRLQAEGGPALRQLITVPATKPSKGEPTCSALFQWVAFPLLDANGRVTALLYGGSPLNHNYEMVDTFRNIIFSKSLYNNKPLGTVTVFLDGTRVATNVLGPEGQRAVGTEVSDEVRQAVLEKGLTWRSRAWVVDAWYLSGYQPLRDPDDRIIGMLYVGLLEAPYSELQVDLILSFLKPVIVVLVVALGAAWLIFRKITRPLENLRKNAELIAEGDWNCSIEQGRTYSEIADLAGSFSRMQQAIKRRDRELNERNEQLAGTNEKLRTTNDNYTSTLRFVTHELKSPLATIQSMIDVLVAGMLGEVPDKARGSLTRIKRNCEELQDMVKNYLDLARAERGELVADKEQIDILSDVVDPCVTQTEPLFDSRRLDLEVDCPEDLEVEADAELMRIALSNYLSNAAKYGREGGRAKLTAATDEGRLTVSVWNEGQGFSRDEGKRLFSKFSRLTNDNTRGKRGSGLGLYLCKQVLELHGGEVWAEAEPGQWARFSFRFPCREESKGPGGGIGETGTD